MKKAVLLCASIMSTAFVMPVKAQTSEPLLDEVITTATRSGAKEILDVPKAVTTLDASALESLGVSDVLDLNTAVPNVYVNTTSSPISNTPLRIRGIGTGGGNPGFESAVGVYVDEIYRSRPGTALATLFDMEGLDILRGPQGTLFGKNTTAGAMTIRTAVPKFDAFSASVEGSVENYGGYSVDGMFNVPFSDNAAFRLSATANHTDGYFTNPIIDKDDVAGGSDWATRAQFAFEPNDSMSVRLIADFSTWQSGYNYNSSTRIDSRDLDGSQNGFFGPFAFNQLLVPGVGAVPAPAGLDTAANYWYWDLATPGAEADPFAREIVTQSLSDHQIDQWGLASILNYDFSNGISLKSITSYREIDSDNEDGDWDFGPLNFANTLNVFQDFETFSQEFLLSGDLGDKAEFLAGFHYFNETIDYSRIASANTQVAGLLLPAGLNTALLGVAGTNPDYNFQDVTSDQEETSYGIFGQVTYDVTDQFSLIGGLRWNKIDKDFEFRNLAAPTPGQYFNDVANNAVVFLLADAGLATAFPHESDLSNEELTYNATLQYRPNDDMQLYASYSRGFKAGGFNFTENGAAGEPSLSRFNPADPNTVIVPDAPVGIAAALGVPFTLFAPFTPDTSDFAPEFVDSYELGFRYEYGGRGRLSVTGFYSDYSDLQVSVFNGLTFEVINAGTSTSQGIEVENTFAVNEDLTLNISGTYLDATYGTDAGTISTGLPAGRARGLAPEVSIMASANYERPLSDKLDFFANVNYSYFSEMFIAEGSCRSLDANGEPTVGTTYDVCSAGALAGLSENQLAQETQDAYGVAGASLGLRTSGGFDISAFCRNCFDEEYFSYGFNQPFTPGGSPLAQLGAPRVYGLRLKKTFN